MKYNNNFTEVRDWGIIHSDLTIELPYKKCFIDVNYKKICDYAIKKGVDTHDLLNVLFGIFLHNFYNVNEVCFKEIVDGKGISFIEICAESDNSLDFLMKEYINNKENFQWQKIYNTNEYIAIDNQMDIILQIYEEDTKMFFCLSYNESKYITAIIESLINSFVFMIEKLINKSEKPINQIDCNANMHRIINEFNDTNESIPENKTVIDLFVERVRKTPNDTAIILDDEVVTFKQLDMNVNNLAHKLIHLGVEEGDFIPLYAARSIELIVGILAILKSGGVYVPIADNNAALNIISECNPNLMLYYNKELEGISNILCLKIEYHANLENPVDSVNVCPKPDDVASCIYTSGSTGKSKGVLLTHLGFLNTVLTNIKVYELTTKDVVLQYSSYTYAQSIIDIFVGIIAAKICLISDEDYRDIYALEKICKKNGVTVMALTPSLISELDPDKFETIRILDSTGESAKSSVLVNWTNYCEVLNSYGSTELTGNTSVYRVKGNEKNIIPIGRPIFNNRYYIIDRFNKVCDIGMLGELYIEGVGLSKGYLNDEKLTNTKFVKNPITGNIAFKSGDMARWFPDGSVEFEGRQDSQVKIRGKRANLNNIKEVIDKLNGIEDSLISIQKDRQGDEVICAYLVSEKEIDVLQIKSTLVSKLPDYMVPAFITQIDKIPLNKNSKVDYFALPQITYEHTNVKSLAPLTKYEKMLSDLICKELKINNVCLDSKFVEIGGDSIKAMRIVAGLRKLGYKLLISQLISDNNLASVAKTIEIAYKTFKEKINISREDLAVIEEFYNIDKYKIKTVLELSPLQEGMLYECIEKPERNIYVNQFTIKNIFNKDYVVRTIDVLAKIYPVLTSNIVYDKLNKPLHVIFNDKDIDFEIIEISEGTESEQSKKIINNEANRKINVQKDPLFRIKYIQNKDGVGTLILTYHHIILDGWSIEVLARKIIEIWNSFSNSLDVYNDERIFKEYEFYNHAVSQHDDEETLRYWSAYLKEFNNSNSLPFVSVVDKESEVYNFYIEELDSAIGDKMSALSKKYNVPVSNILETAWGILLSEYSGSNDVVFGKIISNRENFVGEIDEQIGFFINTIPVRIKYNLNDKFIDIIKSNRDNSINSIPYSFCSLAKIQKKICQMEMIKSIFSIENYYRDDEYNNGIIVQELSESTNCPLTVNVSFIGKTIKIKITYNTGFYNEEKVSRIYNKYIHILNCMLIDPTSAIGFSDLLLESDKREVLKKFNDTKIDFKNKKTFIELFEKQVEKTPNNIAIVCGSEMITYRQLNNKANCVAHRLRKLGVKANDLIPIIARRSVEMIIGIYGILKAGGGYVPIDPKFPKDRIDYILKDCDAKILLKFQADIQTNLFEINLEEVELYKGAVENLEIISGLDNYVYCIYTSGTTGNPKGVININRGMINMLLYMSKKYTLCEQDVILQKTPYTFDASVWEITWWAINGASVSLLSPNGEQEPSEICETIDNTGVTVIQFVPSMLNMFLEYMDKHENVFTRVKYLLTIGEPLNINTVRRIDKLSKDVNNTNLRIINEYGPTEASVFVTTYECKADMDTILIGKPISNTQIYIVNNKKLCGVGMVGEICIAGDSLSIGYLNKKDLTGAKFVNNLFDCGKMYYTGDIARWLPDGNIEIFGRIDDQVKIRGNRVELTEIENQIRNIENVEDCAVIIKKDFSGNNAIHAYIVSEETISDTNIIEQLARKLPEYMIPSYIGRIDKIPVTRSGKLDRGALPELHINRIDTYVAPKTREETVLCRIYEEILKINKIGIKDNFFRLGGHSLLAILLINKIDLFFGVKLNIQDIFECPVIEELAKKIDCKSNVGNFSIPVVSQCNLCEASSSQKRIFLLNEMDPMALSYNLSEVYKLRGKIKKEQMYRAIKELVTRHEILRTDFVNIDGKLCQRIHKEIELDFGIIDDNLSNDKSIVKQFVQPFNLAQAPLFRIRLVERDSYCLLFIDLHHIIGDGESIKKLIAELAQIYSKKFS